MNDNQLQELLQRYESTLAEARILNAQSWALQLELFSDIRRRKAAGSLNRLVRLKLAAVVAGIGWVVALCSIAWVSGFRNPWFTVSLLSIALFSAYAIIQYLVQVVRIRQLDFDASVTDLQQKLAKLQASTIRCTGILWLQMPFYATWFWSSRWIAENPVPFYAIALPIAVILAAAAIWLCRSISAKNMHRSWVRRLMMAGNEYNNLVAASEFLEEISDFRKELS